MVDFVTNQFRLKKRIAGIIKKMIPAFK